MHPGPGCAVLPLPQGVCVWVGGGGSVPQRGGLDKGRTWAGSTWAAGAAALAVASQGAPRISRRARLAASLQDGPTWRPEAIAKGGKRQFPYLVDPNTGTGGRLQGGLPLQR